MVKFFHYTFRIIFLILIYVNGHGQKPPIDYQAIKSWPDMGGWKISDDGKFVSYTVRQDTKMTLYINASDGSFKKEISDLPGNFFVSCEFTKYNRKGIIRLPGDSLGIIDLFTGEETIIANCRSYQIITAGKDDCLTYLLKNKDLVLFNLTSHEKKIYNKVNNYLFSNHGNILLLEKEGAPNGMPSVIEWINLKKPSSNIIWEGTKSGSYVIDESESRLVFFSEDTGGTIWFYEDGFPSASVLINASDNTFEPGTRISPTRPYSIIGLQYSLTSDRLFFNITFPVAKVTKDIKKSSVDIWNYKDRKLQEEQIQPENAPPITYLCVIDLSDKKVRILSQKGDKSFPKLNEGNNYKYLLVTRERVPPGIKTSIDQQEICIVETLTGVRKCLGVSYSSNVKFSSGGKYILWYEPQQKAYYTYDLQKGKTVNISNEIKVPIYDETWNFPTFASSHKPTPVWLENDDAVLIYDRYDIWEVDPTGNKLPINLTKGYGRKNKIVLRCLHYQISNQSIDQPAVKKDSTIILAGFDEIHKRNDFFSLNIKQDPLVQKLTVNTTEYYYFPQAYFQIHLPNYLNKAKSSNTFLLFRQSANEYPNLIVTKDFTTFTQISQLAPQKNFNWLTTQLVNWTTFDRHPAQGILYKPENFDSTKKYPIIFYFYEDISSTLNNFTRPELSTGRMDIPYFVSNGYLVFSPDIHVQIGKTGASVYDYVVSAANLFKSKPWIDPTRMGIQGHSQGGFEVNYLVTQTKMFAAAASAAGESDLLSHYGTLRYGPEAGQSYGENSQTRMAVPFWSDKLRYLHNSPLYYADKVSTPLLIMHNKKDAAVAWSQGVEFITALRWLSKPSWMLQYDDGNHILTKESDQLDYSIRLAQFFDHYLKGMPAPKWITEGVPGKLKQIETGYGLDSANSCGPNCNICKKINEEYRKVHGQ